MKIVIAPDSFKESLTAMQVAKAIEAGFTEIFPHAQYIKIPMADGGEGTVQAMIEATSGRRVECLVSDPLGLPIQSFYGLTGGELIAIIEMAAASGLELVSAHQRNPLITTSYGTGELIRAALDAGARRFLLGIGGSATNDGGAGMLQALGVRLLNEQGENIGFGGAQLVQLSRIDVSGLDPRIKESSFEVACDVKNPLIGPNGASAVFGPQKGATPEMVERLDANLKHFAQVIVKDLGIDVTYVPGAGAGGGIGAAMLAFLNGNLRPGSEIVADAVSLAEHVKDADLVVSGEGRIDSQTVHGKTPIGVATVAQHLEKPVIVIAGSVSHNYEAVHELGINAAFGSINRVCSIDEAYQEAALNVQITARNVAAALKVGMNLQHTPRH